VGSGWLFGSHLQGAGGLGWAIVRSEVGQRCFFPDDPQDDGPIAIVVRCLTVRYVVGDESK